MNPACRHPPLCFHRIRSASPTGGRIGVRSNEIRIVGVEGAATRLLRTVTDADMVSLTDWSRNGKYILAYIEYRSSPAQIVLISASDGSVHVLKQADGWPGRMSFSPDGKFILYDGQGSSAPDVHLLSIDGRRDIALAPHPADDFAAGWSPDGQHILFASNRTGPLSLWTLAVKDGEAQGEPQLAPCRRREHRAHGHHAKRLAFTTGSTPGLVDVYTAAIDPESGSVTRSP